METVSVGNVSSQHFAYDHFLMGEKWEKTNEVVNIKDTHPKTIVESSVYDGINKAVWHCNPMTNEICKAKRWMVQCLCKIKHQEESVQWKPAKYK